MVHADEPYPSKWMRGSFATIVASRPDMMMPPVSSLGKTDSKWSSAPRKPVFQRMTSAFSSLPFSHLTPFPVISLNIGKRFSTPLRFTSSTRRKRQPRSGNDRCRRQTVSSPIATALWPAISSKGTSLKTGGQRVTQIVMVTFEIWSSSRIADMPALTTTTRFPLKIVGCFKIFCVQLFTGEQVSSRVRRNVRVFPCTGGVNDPHC